MINSNDIYFLTGKFIIGLLIFVRITGLFLSAPFFKSMAINIQLKVIISFVLAFTLTAMHWENQPQIDFHLWNIVFLVMKEMFIGFIIGYSASLVFWGAKLAGGIIDFDMGYQAAAMFNMGDDSPTLVGNMFEMATLVLFLILNGHHYLIESLNASLDIIPLTTLQFTDSAKDLMIKVATSVIIIGIKISAPILVALFLTNLVLALLARIAPQTNIFVMSFQLKIAVGLLVLLISTPILIMVAKNSLELFQGETMKIIMALGSGTV
jgi:flagellar biosynthetic protein FliR